MSNVDVIGLDDFEFRRFGTRGAPVLRFTFEHCCFGECGDCPGYVAEAAAGDRLDWECDCNCHAQEAAS